MSLTRTALAALAAFAASLSASPVKAGVPEDMKLRIEQRRAAEAYDLGMQHPDMLGQPLFDYYFGIAAGSLSLAVGPVSDRVSVTAGPTASLALLAGKKYRRGTGASGMARVAVGKRLSLSAETHYLNLAYYGLNRNRTAQLTSASLGLERQLGLPMKPVLSLSGSIGREKNRRGRPDLTRRITGGRIGLMAFPSDRIAVALGYGLSRWRYDGADPLFGVPRRDWFHALDAAMQVMLQPGLSLRLQGQILRDEANIPLYDYSQKQITVTLRKEWN